MPVVDTSAFVAALFQDPPPAGLLDRLSGGDFHCPHLVDVEFTQAVRRLVAAGAVTLERAGTGRADFAALSIVRYPHGPLVDRAWDLRENLTAYDAVFVALSEALDVPLVTTDTKPATAPGHHAAIEAF